MLKDTKVLEAKAWNIRDFPVALRKQIKSFAAIRGESIAQTIEFLLSDTLSRKMFKIAKTASQIDRRK